MVQWLRLRLNAGAAGLIPGQETEDPQCLVAKTYQNIKWKEYCNNFIKDFKNGSHQKTLKKTKRILKNEPILE